MLRFLDDAADGVSRVGWALAAVSVHHAYAVAFAVSLILLFLSRGGSAALRPALIAVAAGAWAQAFILADRLVLGGCLYAVAFLTALLAGRRIDLAGRMDDGSRLRDMNGSAPLLATPDCIAVGILILTSLLLRVYAIEAIPWFVDVEPGGAYLESLSPHGMARYVTHNRVLDDGYFHMVGRWAFVQILGPSIVTLRAVSVAFGVLSVVLCYLVARQFTGPGWAFAAGALLATDSAHLFWSRIEASQIVAASVGTFLSVLLAIWLARTWSVTAAVAVMLWMPATRFFYAAAVAMVLLPVLVCVAGIARRESRRACWRVVPFVLAGCVLWFHSSSLLHSAAAGHWQRISTLNIYGRSAIEPHDPRGELGELSVWAQVRFQGSRVVDNGRRFAAHLAHNRDEFSNWLMMAQADGHHRRSANAVVVALIFPALGFLVGARADPRVLVLLMWLFATILPGMFSEDPEPRRVVGFMSAIPVIITVFLALCAAPAINPRRRRFVLPGVVAVTLLCIASSNVASHFLTGRQEPGVGRYVEFVAPAFADADAVFHNIEDEAFAATLLFGNAREFLRRRPCFAFVSDWDAEWPSVTSENPECIFDDALYAHLPPADSGRSAWVPTRTAAYLLEIDSPDVDELSERLRRRFPAASFERQRFFLPPYGERDVVLIRARRDDTARE